MRSNDTLFLHLRALQIVQPLSNLFAEEATSPSVFNGIWVVFAVPVVFRSLVEQVAEVLHHHLLVLNVRD